jgi:hypothetical protein
MRREEQFDVYGGRPATAVLDVSTRGFDVTVWVTDDDGEVWLALVPDPDSDVPRMGGHVPCRPIGSKGLPDAGYVAGGALPPGTLAAGSTNGVTVASAGGFWVAVSYEDAVATILFSTTVVEIRPPPRGGVASA